MKLYNSKWQTITQIAAATSMVGTAILFFMASGLFEESLLMSVVLLYILVFIRQKTETDRIHEARYKSLFATLAALLASLIAFSFVWMLHPDITIDRTFFLKITVLFLLFYHFSFYTRIFFFKTINSLKNNRLIMNIYLVASYLVLVLIIFIWLRS